MDKTHHQIQLRLQAMADLDLAEKGQRFFKEPVRMYGTKTADIRKMGKRIFGELDNCSKQTIFDLCEMLWQSGYMEESFIACFFAESLSDQYQPEDLFIFEQWIDRYVTNWASCDTLCNHSVGMLLEAYPDLIESVKTWTMSANRWKKRAAAVSLILPARKGLFLYDIFEIADHLLLDTDDMVQKGYGWMLKAAADAHQEAVFNYVISKKAVMPRTALRYAIEKMPVELKKEAMKK